nr:GNAT family N-acetyltransferase [Longispora albida]
MTSTVPVRLLGDGDRADVLRVLARTPVAAAPIAERVEAGGIAAWRTGGQIFGHGQRGRLEAVCWRGASLIPTGAARPFADLLAGQPRTVGSIAGPADTVLELWRGLEPAWGPARSVRECQPFLVTGSPAAVEPDPHVRLVRRRELAVLYPAAVAMYSEELGVQPSADEYRERVSGLIRARRCYARIENGEVIFKADLAVVSRSTAQVQGVWVAPSHRGRGLAAAGMAAVIADGLRRLAPTISLYVNDYNAAARRVYAQCGFRQIDTFATVLF